MHCQRRFEQAAEVTQRFWSGRRPLSASMDNHHADGIVSIARKVPPGENNALLAPQSERFYLPAYIAQRGWVASLPWGC